MIKQTQKLQQHTELSGLHASLSGPQILAPFLVEDTHKASLLKICPEHQQAVANVRYQQLILLKLRLTLRAQALNGNMP